jgi:hypothetical protein
MDCGGRDSGMAHSNGDLMQIADFYISSSIEASNGGLLVTVYFQISLGVHTAPIAVAS